MHEYAQQHSPLRNRRPSSFFQANHTYESHLRVGLIRLKKSCVFVTIASCRFRIWILLHAFLPFVKKGAVFLASCLLSAASTGGKSFKGCHEEQFPSQKIRLHPLKLLPPMEAAGSKQEAIKTVPSFTNGKKACRSIYILKRQLAIVTKHKAIVTDN